jgi:glycosyltransferase involved in cell wall biosynthesis
MVDISVIIPVYGDARRLRKCLSALEHQSLPRSRFEVVVVDNGATFDVARLRRDFPLVRWVSEGAPGSYAARNRGLHESVGRILAFTDADCVPRSDWLQNAEAALRNSDATIVGGEIEFVSSHAGALNVYENLEENLFYAVNHRRAIETHRFAVTANLITIREVFERVGRFNDRLKSSGDREWVQRAQRHGEKLRYAESAVVSHPRRDSFGGIARKITRLKGGMVQLAKSQPQTQLKYAFRYTLLDPAMYRLVCRPLAGAGLANRTRLCWIIMLLTGLGTAESLRVWMGGTPSRE